MLHRSRLHVRTRNIPGWHELTWADVQEVKERYAIWNQEHLKLDMVAPFDENFAKAKTYCE